MTVLTLLIGGITALWNPLGIASFSKSQILEAGETAVLSHSAGLLGLSTVTQCSQAEVCYQRSAQSTAKLSSHYFVATCAYSCGALQQCCGSSSSHKPVQSSHDLKGVLHALGKVRCKKARLA